jgi:hypothetical protein
MTRKVISLRGCLLAASAFLAFLAPILPVMQPLLTESLESAVLWTHWFVAPIAIIIARPGIIAWAPLLGFACLITFTSYSGLADRASEFSYVALPLVWSIIAYRFGAYLAVRPGLEVVWRGLVSGVTTLNIITFVYMGMVASGHVDIVALFERVQRDTYFGLDRFAIGNPIYVPFMMTAMLHAGLIVWARRKPQIIAVTLNLATALVSQSRLVIFIALLIFFFELVRTGLFRTSIILLATSIAMAANWDIIGPLMESLSSRLAGQDSGSSEDRSRIFGLVLKDLSAGTLLIGDGLLGSYQMMLITSGEWRTVESAALQMLVEVGLIGIVLYIAALMWQLPGHAVAAKQYSVVSLLIWMQMLVLVPVFGTMSFVFFALGAASRARAQGVPDPILSTRDPPNLYAIQPVKHEA